MTTASFSHSSNTKTSSGTWIPFADLSPMIQEVTNQSEWQSGNALNLIARGTGGAYARKNINEVRLTVSYSQ